MDMSTYYDRLNTITTSIEDRFYAEKQLNAIECLQYLLGAKKVQLPQYVHDTLDDMLHTYCISLGMKFDDSSLMDDDFYSDAIDDIINEAYVEHQW